MSKKPDCTPENPQCAACRIGMSMRRRIVFVTDTDDLAEQWRAEGRKRIAALRYARELRREVV